MAGSYNWYFESGYTIIAECRQRQIQDFGRGGAEGRHDLWCTPSFLPFLIVKRGVHAPHAPLDPGVLEYFRRNTTIYAADG